MFEDLRPGYGCLFLGEAYWTVLTFSPDLSPLCALLLVMKMEGASTSFPAVDSILVERVLESEEGSFRTERFQIHSAQKQGGSLCKKMGTHPWGLG